MKDEKNRLNASSKGANQRLEVARQRLQQLSGEHEQQQRVVNAKSEIAEEGCPRVTPKMYANLISYY